MGLLLLFSLSVSADDTKYNVKVRLPLVNGIITIPDQSNSPDATVRITCKPDDNYGVKTVYYAFKKADGTFSPTMSATPDNTYPDDRAAKEQVFKFTMPAGDVEVWADFSLLRTLFIHQAPHGKIKPVYGVDKNKRDSSMVRNLPAMPVKLTVLPDSDKTAKLGYQLVDVELVNLDPSYCVKTAKEITIYMPAEDDTVHVTPVFGKSHYGVNLKIDNPNITTVTVDNAAPKRRDEVTATIKTKKGYIPANVSITGCMSSWQMGKPRQLDDGGWEVLYRFKVDLEDVTVHVGHQQVFAVTVNDVQKSGRVKTYIPEMIPGFPGVALGGQQVPVVFQMPDKYSAKFTLQGGSSNALVYHNMLKNSFADKGMEGWTESQDYVNYGLPTKVFIDSLGNRYWHTSVKNTMSQSVSLSGLTFPKLAVKDDKLTVAAIASINPCSAHIAKASIVASASLGTEAELVVADMQEKNTGWATVLKMGQIDRKASQLKFVVDAEGSNPNKKRAYDGPMFDNLCLLLPTSAETIKNEDVLIFTVGSQDVTVDYTPSGTQNQVSCVKTANATVTLINTVTGEEGETVKAMRNDLIKIKGTPNDGFAFTSMALCKVMPESDDDYEEDDAQELYSDSIKIDTREYYYSFVMGENADFTVIHSTGTMNLVVNRNYGGSLTVDNTSAKQGDKVLVTVTPNPGCKLKRIKTDRDGITFKEENVDATTRGGSYSFEMPGTSLTLTPEFYVPVKTADQLDSLSMRLGEFYLDNDLDLGDNWKKRITVRGTFNGNGHRITYGGKTSLFAKVLKGASVCHLYVKANVKRADAYIGGITLVNAGTIEDCEVSGLLKNEQVDGVVGGVAGQNGPLSGTISHCHVLCDTIDGQKAYGIASQQKGATVSGNVFSGQFVYRSGHAYMISNDLQNATIEGNYYVQNPVNLRAEIGNGIEEKTSASLVSLANDMAETYPVFAASIMNKYGDGFAVGLTIPENVSLVNISSRSASAGTVVTATVSVFGNNHLDGITVSAPDGSDAQSCTFRDNYDNVYSFSFVMPAHDVNVSFKTQEGQYIYTQQQLMAIDDQQGIFYLGRDIELNNWEKWLVLNGIFYGGGHTIKYSASSSCYGLFKKIRRDALLQDLRVEGNVETETDCAGIAYENQGTIRNCHFSGSIKKMSVKVSALVIDAVSAISCIVDKDSSLIDYCSATAKLVSPNSQATVDKSPLCFQGAENIKDCQWVSPTQTDKYQEQLNLAATAHKDYPVYAQGIIDKINPCVIVGSDTIRVQNGQKLSELTIIDGQPFVCTSDILVDRVIYKRKPSTNPEQWVLPFDFSRIAGSGTFEYHLIIEKNGIFQVDENGTTLTITASPTNLNYKAGEPWIIKNDGSEYVLTNNGSPITIKATSKNLVKQYGAAIDKGCFYAAYDSIPAKIAHEGLMYAWNPIKLEFECSDSFSIDPFRFYVQFYNSDKHKFVTFANTNWGRKYAKSLAKSTQQAPRRLASVVADGWQPVILDPRYPQSVTADMLDNYEMAYLTDVNAQTLSEDADAPLYVVSLVYQMVDSEEELKTAIPLLVRAKRSDAKPLADEQTGAEIDALLLMSMIVDDDYVRDTELDDFRMPHYWCASFGNRLDIWPMPSPERYADWADFGCMLFDDNDYEQSFNYPDITDNRTTTPMSYCISVFNTDTFEPLPLLGNRVFVEFVGADEATGIENVQTSNLKPQTSKAYNLSGQRVSASYKGIILQNGRKIYRK